MVVGTSEDVEETFTYILYCQFSLVGHTYKRSQCTGEDTSDV
jgi:hypothetical protein